jgi:hypothetical protein
MRDFRLSRPPRLLRRSTVHLDNVVLIPASLLPLKTEWQAIANALPPGETLIVLPSHAKPQRVARSVAETLREKGQHVRLLDKDLRLLLV